MSGLTLKRLTSFEFAIGIGYLEVWINPNVVAYLSPRRRFDSRDDKHHLDGTRLFFQQESGVLDVKEDIGYVTAILQSGRGGVCKECFEILKEGWATLCVDCIRHRHGGVHVDPEEATA